MDTMAAVNFRQLMFDNGYNPLEIIADGELHRFTVNGKSQDEAGWYVLFDGGPIPAGAFGDWRSGNKFTWSEKSEAQMSTAESKTYQEAMEHARRLRDEARQQEQARAQKRAVSIWEKAQPASDHSYLKNKGVSSYGLRCHKKTLVMPLVDPQGQITTLQFISADGQKRFLTGGKKQGSFFEIPGTGEVFYLVEGYATGATIHAATGATVIVCCDAGNLEPVAGAIRDKHPRALIVICADNDQWTEGNPGMAKATAAARLVNGRIAVPSFADVSKQPTDFNDLAQLEGIEKVYQQIKRAEAPKEDESPSIWSDELLSELQDALNRNEEGDALLIKHRFQNKLVFDHTEGAWYRFQGHHWHRDDINRVREVVIKISDLFVNGAIRCLDRLRKSDKIAGPEPDEEQKAKSKKLLDLREKLLKRASALRGETRARNILSWAAAGDPLGVTSEVWEPDPWLLGVNNGVVELKTGNFRPGKPDDFIRTFSPIDYDPQAECPTWNKFLWDIFAQPDENDSILLTDFFHKLLGYTLIGDCREAVFIILYGEGRNGKTSLLETVRHILGPYSFKVSPELILKKSRPSGPGSPDADTLALRHKRFVFCAETEEGRRLDGNRVKHLCGNDCLTARGLYEKRPTEFLPTHTLYLMTNDKPQIRSDDFAIWQRIKPVPFLVSFLDDPQGPWQRPVDKDMQKKLKAEAAGILTWMVDGCQIYLTEGLETPAIIIDEAKEYRSDESLLQQWSREACTLTPHGEVKSKELFDSFTQWLKNNGYQEWGHKTFSGRLLKEFKEYGIEKTRRAEGIIFTNINLKPM